MKKGFTLVELSIVLVIIGLLIGGILVAQSMIGTTRIQGQIRQFQQVDIAATNFKTKYNCIPGDCANIEPAGTPDGKLRDSSGGADNMDGEVRGFWRQLYNTGDWKESYSQFFGGSAIGDIIPAGVNFPKAVLNEKAGITVIAPDETSSTSIFIENGQPLNIYMVARHTRRSNVDSDVETAFKVADLVAIEAKIDDGVHYTGNIRAAGRGDGLGQRPTNTNDCTTNGTGGTYRMESTLNEACLFGVKMFSQVGSQ